MSDTEKPAENTTPTDVPAGEPAVPPPQPQPTDIWEWMEKAHPHNIIALSFAAPDYGSEYFERALLTLHKRKWSPFKVFFFLYLMLSPVLWPPFFSREKPLTDNRVLIRWGIMILVLGMIIAAHYLVYSRLGLAVPFGLTLVPVMSCVALAHILITTEFATPWHEAYRRFHPAVLMVANPKKKKSK